MKNKFIIFIIPLLILLNAGIGMAEITNDADNQTGDAQKATTVLVGDQINWFVISAGGNKGTSANYSLNGTACQTAVGTGSSSGYKISHGFWKGTSGGGCCLLRGDALHDNQLILVNDLVFLVNHVFKGGPPPFCIDEGDALADNGLILVNDLVYLVNHVFKGGPPPSPC